MKKLFFIFLTSLTFIFTGCLDTTPMNNSGQGSLKGNQGSNPLFDPDYYYEIDTWGTNADVWEFTPMSNPDYVCIVVGENAGRTQQCIPKPIQKETK